MSLDHNRWSNIARGTEQNVVRSPLGSVLLSTAYRLVGVTGIRPEMLPFKQYRIHLMVYSCFRVLLCHFVPSACCNIVSARWSYQYSRGSTAGLTASSRTGSPTWNRDSSRKILHSITPIPIPSSLEIYQKNSRELRSQSQV